MILLQLSLFFSCYHDIASFLFVTSIKCAKLQKKILVKLLYVKRYLEVATFV